MQSTLPEPLQSIEVPAQPTPPAAWLGTPRTHDWLPLALSMFHAGCGSAAIAHACHRTPTSVRGVLARRGLHFARNRRPPKPVISYRPLPSVLRYRASVVLQRAAELHGVSVRDIIAVGKTKEVVTARWDAMTALMLCGLTCEEAGRACHKDHSTVLHGVGKVKADQDAYARAQNMALGVGMLVQPERLADVLRGKMAGATPENLRAVRRWLEVAICGKPVRGFDTGATLAHGRYLVATRYQAAVVEALRSCGMDDQAALVTWQMARVA